MLRGSCMLFKDMGLPMNLALGRADVFEVAFPEAVCAQDSVGLFGAFPGQEIAPRFRPGSAGRAPCSLMGKVIVAEMPKADKRGGF